MTATQLQINERIAIDTFSRLALANIGVAIAAFGIAAAMAIMPLRIADRYTLPLSAVRNRFTATDRWRRSARAGAHGSSRTR